MTGRWSLCVAAVLVAASACSPQCGTNSKLPGTTRLAAIPSPSPTPTTALAASSPPFHGGEVGVAYAAVLLSATGGVAPYAWSVTVGALPGGLSLGSGASVSGNPTSAGTFSFTIQLADAKKGTASLAGTITIVPPLTSSLIPACSQYCKVELGCVNVCGAFGQLSGGDGQYAYQLTQGPLPAGTSLSGLSLTGTFKGVSGYLKFTVQVTDGFGAIATVSPTFWMYDHIALAGGSCVGNYATGCSVNLPISGGVPGSPVSVRLLSVAPDPKQGCWPPSPTAPPPNYGLSVSGGSVTISIPKQIPSGYGAIWTVAVNDQTLCAQSVTCTSAPATVLIEVMCG